MSFQQSSRQLARAARSISQSGQSHARQDLSEPFSRLCLCQIRSYSATPSHRASPLEVTTKSPVKDIKEIKQQNATPEELREQAVQRVKMKQKAEQARSLAQSQIPGSLAPNSFFADEDTTTQQPAKRPPTAAEKSYEEEDLKDQPSPFATRNPSNMAVALNPRPNARARWQRTMVIRDIRRRGRLPKATLIARTERSHLSRSHFFKTSMKKLAPLARQIAGKSLDEAITQMRFSRKKAAIDVRRHLIMARDEAIVARGMGLPSPSSDAEAQTPTSSTHSDPSTAPPLPTQNADLSLATTAPYQRRSPNPTDIYIAEAWTNRGPYGMEPDYRAKGRVNLMRPPHTGLSVLLKEERTRTRERAEKEAKAIRKRMGKNMWTALPDRVVVRQSQAVLW